MAVAVKIGPWGAPGGQRRDINAGSRPQSLVSVTIWSFKALGGAICGFSYVYVDQNGEPIKVGPWGNADPEHRITNIQMGPDEYLCDLSGNANESTGIISLRLVTNQRQFMVGTPLEQTTFSVPLGNGKVVAFFGHSDNDYLRALGIYVPVMKGSPVKVGPWGGSSGVPVDITTPVQLKSVGGTDSSDGFSFTYVDLTGQSIHVRPWGPANGQENIFDLNQGEYVNKITRTTADDRVSFTTNQARGFVLGERGTAAFSVPLPDDRDDKGAVVGFFGRKGDNLVALGVYVGLAPHEP